MRSSQTVSFSPPALSDEDVKTAAAMLAKGETMEKLMDRFGVARSTLYKHGLRKHPPPATKPKRRLKPPAQ